MRGRRIDAASSADPGVEAILKDGVRGAPDVAALASLDAARRELAVLVWHYHDDDVAGPAAAVALSVAGLPADLRTARLAHHRVDATHSNPYGLWQSLGSPVAPTKPQYQQLEAASRLALLTGAPDSVAVAADGTAQLAFPLPRQAVSLLVLSW
jgi:xylan 1,4-beta-xylosidase